MESGVSDINSIKLWGTKKLWWATKCTPPKTNMEPENGPLEKEIPFGNHPFQGNHVSFSGVYIYLPVPWWFYIYLAIDRILKEPIFVFPDARSSMPKLPGKDARGLGQRVFFYSKTYHKNLIYLQDYNMKIYRDNSSLNEGFLFGVSRHLKMVHKNPGW